MTGFLGFLARLGHKVVEVAGATWYDVQPRIFLAVPYFRTINVSEESIKELLRRYHLRGLRFATDASQFGFESSVAINRDLAYDFHSQHPKARNQTRRGLEHCSVEQIDFPFLAREGMRLNLDTAARQGIRNQYIDNGYWSRYCVAAADCAGMSAWGAFAEGKLAAFLVAAEIDGWVEWILNHSLSEARQVYANNALVYVAARRFLQDQQHRGICYGLGSLEPTPDLDHFKVRMGWELVPVRQRLVLSKGLGLAARVVPEGVLRGMGRLGSGTYSMRKVLALFLKYREQGFGGGVGMGQDFRTSDEEDPTRRRGDAK